MKRDEKKRLNDIKTYMGTGLAVAVMPVLAPVVTDTSFAAPVALGFALSGGTLAVAANVALVRLQAEPDVKDDPPES